MDILKQFDLPGRILSCRSYGNGHINDTYMVVCKEKDGQISRYVLQRINRTVFHHPDEVMENITGILAWIRAKVQAEGGDPDREVLTLIAGKTGKPFAVDEEDEYWRIYHFIDHAVCYETAESEEIFRQSAIAFGRFQRQLSDYPAESLHETIREFHYTPGRYRQFQRVLERDPAGRCASAEAEIAFLMEKRGLAELLSNAYQEGKLPLRVTHNDTKLNNIMFDRQTGKALCILDLDTVMPGFSVTDFGDAIRFGASTAAEDEPELEKVHFDRHLYEVYREGFMEGCQDALTPEEIRLLPDGARVITYEQALRFLTDYLEGDRYYKTAYPDHNLIRARTQIRLLQEMCESI